MPPRRATATPTRRSPRISERSQTPTSRVQREESIGSDLTSRPSSPEVIERMTTPVSQRSHQLQQRPGPSSFSLNSIAVKQEDASTSYAPSRFFLREQSMDSNSQLGSPQSFGSRLLRGAQYGLFEAQNANTSASIFSSGSSEQPSSYRQEEQITAQLQNQSQASQASSRGRRRSSGQKKARTSLDNEAYEPTGSDENDDDDEIGKENRRRRKFKPWPELTGWQKGNQDNAVWMNRTTKKRSPRKSNGRAPDAERGENGEEGYLTDEAAASGKETRMDHVESELESDGENNSLFDGAQPSQNRGGPIPDPPKEPPVSMLTRPISSLSYLITSVVRHILGIVLSVPTRLFGSLSGLFGRLQLRDLLLALTAVMTLGSALYVATHSGSISALDDAPRGGSLFTGVSIPSSSLPSDPDRRKLQAEVDHLNAKFESLVGQFDTLLSARLKEVETKLQKDSDARKEIEFNRLMQNAKRQVSRLAQDELKNVQEGVATSVEVMLRDLHKKVDDQLKRRADDTEDKFFSHLEKEMKKITKYANDEVNQRLKQSFDQNYISSLISESLETYSRDRTGKFDYASITSGAYLDERGTVHKGYRYNSVWNLRSYLAQGRKVAIGDPIKAITPGAGLGAENCWMTGWNSILQVNLTSPKVIDEVVLEHPMPGMSRTAPRRVIVWGLVDASDRQYYQQFRRLGGRTVEQYAAQILPATFYNAIPSEYRGEDMPLILSFFEFKANGSTLQTFNLTQEAQIHPHGIEAVRIQFIDGWAQYPPICIHRVRLHGTDWPVFATQDQG